MADGGAAYSGRTVSSIEEIGRDTWNALVAASGPFNPFVSFEFLHALEASASVGGPSGWTPCHLIAASGAGVIGAAPLYLKQHSQGEYVFDHHWADAFERAGGRYYPKLVCASPFSPVPGPRLLARGAEEREALGAMLIELARQSPVSSLHVNFLTSPEGGFLVRHGALERTGLQYHWFNRGYQSFDDFLNALSSRKRKAVRRERRAAAESGLHIRRLRGGEISERHWDAMWRFYQDTGSRKWGRPYLTRTFFRLIAETMSARLLMIVAESSGEPIAGALHLVGDDALYGRYWGCVEHHPFLHFELCYYQAIEFAIEAGLDRVEAGAQGEHKIARGYEPMLTHSAHWIRDVPFREAIARYLASEADATGAEKDLLGAYAPFRKNGPVKDNDDDA